MIKTRTLSIMIDISFVFFNIFLEKLKFILANCRELE